MWWNGSGCYEGSRLVGKECKNDFNGCLINITNSMKNVIKNMGEDIAMTELEKLAEICHQNLQNSKECRLP